MAISHGDVKPHNIMLVGTSAQLCDFGLARVLGPNSTVTTGSGTPAYIPPEVLADRKPTSTSDQYSLAVSYVELRTGRLPFGGSESYAEVLDAHLKGKLDLSPLLEAERAVIQRAAARRLEDRFPSCQEMIRALRAVCPPDSVPGVQNLCGTATPGVTPLPRPIKRRDGGRHKPGKERPSGALEKFVPWVVAVVLG